MLPLITGFGGALLIYFKYVFCQRDNASQHSAAKEIRNYLLCKAFGIINADSAVLISDVGKPCIKDFDVDFSVAHAENAAVAAACGKGMQIEGAVCIDKAVSKIGVDIEWADRPVSRKSMALISGKEFSIREREYVAAGTVGDTQRFLEIWTKKESIVKATGQGLKAIGTADSLDGSYKFLETRHIVIGDKTYIVSIAGL